MEIETRTVAFEADDELVIEERAGGTPAIRGYAVVYNRLSVDLGGFRERILPGAFDAMLAKQKGRRDLVSYFNHDPNLLLGRESSGTLEVFADAKGVGYVVTPPASRADVLELIQRRDIRGSSFAFSVGVGGESFTTEGGKAIREVREADLYEMGPVVNPAYSATTAAVALRSYEAWLAEQEPAAEQRSVAVPAMLGVAGAVASLLRLKLRG